MRRAHHLILGILLFSPVIASAQGVPNGATGICRDSSYTFSATKRGACSRHGGLLSWLADTTPAVAPQGAQRVDSTGQALLVVKTKVWVNTASSVYHCPGTRWYGATKRGEYMSESAAKERGARPAYGRPCGGRP